MTPGMGFGPDAGKGVRPSRRNALLLLAAAFSGVGPRAMADAAWPVSITRFISPFAAGGALDVLARIVAELLKHELGTTFLVETHPGAGGAIGTRLVTP